MQGGTRVQQQGAQRGSQAEPLVASVVQHRPGLAAAKVAAPAWHGACPDAALPGCPAAAPCTLGDWPAPPPSPPPTHTPSPPPPPPSHHAAPPQPPTPTPHPTPTFAGKVAEGVAAYERALALAPRHAEALYNLGVAYTEQGLIDRALFM